MSEAAQRILASLSAGDRVFLPGSTGEVPSLSAAISSGEGPSLAITTSFVPGINPPLARVDRDAASAPFASGPAGAQASGQLRQLPLSYGAFQRYLEGAEYDAIVLQVGAPGADGRSSLGAAVEFAPTVMRKSRRLIAVVNPNVPDIPGAPSIRLADAELVVETDEALREYEVGAASPVSDAIARNVAAFVGDGAALQIGLGKVPDALLRLVADRRGLRLQSGMLSDGVRLLADAGALDPRFAHASCVHVGTRGYYEWLRGREGFQVRGCEHTHSPVTLAAVPGLVAVNSALSVDLFGQANLETLDGRAVSGVGGAADFARAASLSPTGISIVALPATAGKDRASRIVPRLDGVTSLPRQDIDVVVTEFGAADLRGRSVMERAARLIAIADPSQHETLETAWRTIAARL